jgi:transcriptional regulator with XRE-family HTH domain
MGESNKSGSRLASLRSQRQLSVEDLAARSGVAKAEIEAIEGGTLSPSIAPLVKMARVLGVRLGTFLDDAGGEGPVICRDSSGVEVMRAPGQISSMAGSLSFFSLAKGKVGRSMEPFLVDVHPGLGNAQLSSSHEGEEFIFVLKGEIEVNYGSETWKLSEGDSIYYDSIVAHRVSSASSARLLAVIYAPF